MAGSRVLSAYIVATVDITDAERFALYAKGIAGLAERFGGESVVKGAVTEVLEGDIAVGQRVVVTRFPSVEDAKAYLSSPEYRAACEHRKGAASVAIRLMTA
jgi:uncharacterized protein (DUF1330 family)